MFCEKCGNELNDGAKFCKKCGAATETKEVLTQHTENAVQKPKSSGRIIVIVSIIAVIVLMLVIIIVLVAIIVKKNTVSKVGSIETEVTSEDVTNELPELAPDTEEEYEAYFNKLEYLTLGDDAVSDLATAKEDLSDTYAENTEDKSVAGEDIEKSNEPENEGEIIANALSTTDYANAMDFEWLHDVMESDGTGAGIILDESHAEPISADDNSYLNGGWRAYMYGTDSEYGERFLNAEIDAQGEDLTITLNWKYINLEGTSYEENGSSTFNGKRNSKDGIITAQSSSGNLELSEFYILKDKKHEYAFGAFQYPSGELFVIGLMR